MKQTLNFFLMLTLLSVVCVSCKNKQDNGEASVASVSEEAPLPTGKTLPLNIDRKTKADGHDYHYIINREPIDNTVEDEEGNVFYDNEISILVERDGGQMYKRSFTRENFLSMLDEGFRQYGILDGCRFVKIDKGSVVFSLCVSYPESDLFTPFLLTVHPDGSGSFSPDNTLDVDNFADSAALSSGV